MTGLSGYALSVISAAIMTAIISSFFDGKSGISGIIRLVSGLFLTFVIISPLTNLDFSMVNDYLEEFTVEGEEVAAMGENLAREAEADIIMGRVQAYILDKANSLGVQLDVEVVLDRDNIPVSVKLSGNISPYAKARMAAIITEDLGISKEHQLWIG